MVEVERLTNKQFEKFCQFIYQQAGIRIDDHKVTLLSNRIRRRLRAVGFSDFDVYYAHLISPAGASELENFIDAITTNETSFFRTEDQFEWFVRDLITEWVGQELAGKRSPAIRILSAGCASGAEPYSIAICLAENSYRLRDWSIQVVGSDISAQMLRVAEEGVYTARVMASVTERQRRRHFHRLENERWQIRNELRQFVEFRQQNLMQPLREAPFDCIFIRNVLIYFDKESKQKVLENLVDALAVGGYLLLGPSEGVYGMLDFLRKVSPLVYQKVEQPQRSGRK